MCWVWVLRFAARWRATHPSTASPKFLRIWNRSARLHRLGSTSRRRRSVVSPTIPAHQLDFRVRSHPGSSCFCGSVWQHFEHLVRLEVHNDRSKCMSPPKGKVVNANLWDLVGWFCGQVHDASQNGLTTGLDA